MDTQSVWDKVSTPDSYPRLAEDITTDVLIIGAGITGLTLALELAKAGREVVVVEAERVGAGTTGYSTGNLYVQTQPHYQAIHKKFGADTVRDVAQSRQAAIDHIETIVQTHHIDCHFSRRPSYLYSKGPRSDLVEKEMELLREAGIAVSETNLPFPAKAQRAILLSGARFNPKTYTDGLARAFTKLGGKIYEQTEIREASERSRQCLASTDRNTIKAHVMVMATHVPKGIHKVQMLAAPYRSYVVAARIKGEYPNGHFMDLDPGGYVSSTHAVHGESLDMLMVAGEHHKTGQARNDDTEHYYKKLETYIRQHFEVESIAHRWSAQHYQAADAVPYIGLAHRDSRHFYIASGFFADGLTYGTVAALVLAESIQGRLSPWARAYDATRSAPLAAAPKAIKENLNVLCAYLKDLPGLNDIGSVTELKPGQGGVLERNGEKLAAYRDETDQLHVVSAVCTHMKCIVQFNNVEKSWDCPCHGSRFRIDGSVIEGPAWQPLAQRKADA